MWSEDYKDYQVYVVGESQSALLALQGTSKEVVLRSVFGKVSDQAISIISRLTKVDLKFLWLRAEYNIADLNSKVHPDPVSVVNSNKWRFGDDQFKDQSFLEENVAGVFSKDTNMFELTKDNFQTQNVNLTASSISEGNED